MKIIAFLDCTIGAGGGFDQSLNALEQISRICFEKYKFEVITTELSNVEFLNKLNIKNTLFSFSKIDRLLDIISNNKIFRRVQAKLKIINSLERKLIANECDLVYFVTPSRTAGSLQRLNYITTMWDLCHRDHPEFPEVRQFNSFYFREENVRESLPSAFLILTDSVQLADLAAFRYGIDRDRFLPMPYAPSPFILKNDSNNDVKILLSYDIDPGYFLYPAQFWAHKNHIRILQALPVLKEKYNWCPQIVFLGKDYGNLVHLKKNIDKNGLNNQVRMLGFVPSTHMRTFYNQALAVVMPTYFGPTNLPPLEALICNKPLIYSRHLALQVGEAAILVDPDSKEELAEAMFAVLDSNKRNNLIEAGKRQLKVLTGDRREAEMQLSKTLEKYALRRETWE
jgi:glycosyltransferase involved in cell wall biosynthesis